MNLISIVCSMLLSTKDLYVLHVVLEYRLRVNMLYNDLNHEKHGNKDELLSLTVMVKAKERSS